MPAIVEVYSISSSNILHQRYIQVFRESDDTVYTHERFKTILDHTLDVRPYEFNLARFSVRDIYERTYLKLTSRDFWLEFPQVPQSQGDKFQRGIMVRFSGEIETEVVDGSTIRFLSTSIDQSGASLVQISYRKAIVEKSSGIKVI